MHQKLFGSAWTRWAGSQCSPDHLAEFRSHTSKEGREGKKRK